MLLAFFAFRRSRQDSYWRQRRRAGQRGLRYGVLSLIGFVVGGAFLMITLTIAFVDERNRSAAMPVTQTPTLAALVVATDTPPPPSSTPTEAVIAPTVEVSPEAPVITITATDAPPAAPTQIAEVPTTVPITSGALNIIGIDDMISDDWRPIQASSSFTTSATRFYFFFAYDDIAQGTTWGQILLRDGEVIRERTQQWGVTESAGEAFFFFGDSPGIHTRQLRNSVDSGCATRHFSPVHRRAGVTRPARRQSAPRCGHYCAKAPDSPPGWPRPSIPPNARAKRA